MFGIKGNIPWRFGTSTNSTTAVSFLLTVPFARKKGLMQSALTYTLVSEGQWVRV